MHAVDGELLEGVRLALPYKRVCDVQSLDTAANPVGRESLDRADSGLLDRDALDEPVEGVRGNVVHTHVAHPDVDMAPVSDGKGEGVRVQH